MDIAVAEDMRSLPGIVLYPLVPSMNGGIAELILQGIAQVEVTNTMTLAENGVAENVVQAEAQAGTESAREDVPFNDMHLQLGEGGTHHRFPPPKSRGDLRTLTMKSRTDTDLQVLIKQMMWEGRKQRLRSVQTDNTLAYIPSRFFFLSFQHNDFGLDSSLTNVSDFNISGCCIPISVSHCQPITRKNVTREDQSFKKGESARKRTDYC